MNKEGLTNCEVLVMKVIWSSDEVMSIQEILRAANEAYGKDWKVQTVSTFLSKIVKKGYLDMRRQGRTFFYHPLVTEEAYGRREIKKCVELWGGGKISGLLSAFVQEYGLTAEECREIIGIAAEPHLAAECSGDQRLEV